jgi:cell division protein FtsB
MSTTPAQKRVRKRKKQESPHRRGTWITRWYIIIPLAVTVVSALIFAWYFRPLQIAYHEARNERVLAAKLKMVQTYNSQLESDIKSLETTAGIAEYARRELNLIDKGDHVVIVTRDGKPLSADSQEASPLAALFNGSSVTSPFGAWTSFLDRIFGAQ